MGFCSVYNRESRYCGWAFGYDGYGGSDSWLCGGGSTGDFIVRGWSASAGNTYEQALMSYNTELGDHYFGYSEIGNDIVLGDGVALPTSTLFGAGGSQVNGFNMGIPEPSTFALVGFGAAALGLSRRRSP